MYREIVQNEISDGTHQATGPIVNAKVEQTELEVLPAGESYDPAAGRSGINVSERWAVLAEQGDEEPPVGDEDPLDFVKDEEEEGTQVVIDEDDEGTQEGTQALPVHEERYQEAIARQLANLPNIINFAKEIYFPNRERIIDAEVTNDRRSCSENICSTALGSCPS